MQVRRMLLVSALILTSVGASLGCSVYKSSDRDDFNSNAKTRAPAAKLALTADDQALLETPCSAFDGIGENDLSPLFGSPIHLTMTNQISRKTSTCLVTNHEPSVNLQTVSVVACSWKPVDGDPVPAAADEFAVQTTEDDLRDQGFSVVTTAVSSGDTLRMNCEAYAPTADLIHDRESNEPGTTALSPKFSYFADEMKVSTLSSSGTR